MFASWRLQLREARLAIDGGRYEEAARLLADESLRDFRQAQQLSKELSQHLAERATKRLAAGASDAGWHDVERVGRMGNKETLVGELSEVFAGRAVERAVELLIAGEPKNALQLVKRYRRRLPSNSKLSSLESLCTAWDTAQRQLQAGDLAASVSTIEQLNATVDAVAILPRGKQVRQQVEKFTSHLAQFNEQHRDAHAQLHAALVSEDWQQVLAAADVALSIAPNDRVARGARKKAWHAVGLDATQVYRPKVGAPKFALAHPERNTDHRPPQADRDTANEPAVAERYVMWIDAVGGYLVCLDSEIVIGQPNGGSQPAVGILADVSRRHVVLRREAGQYVLEPLGPTKVDGTPIKSPTVLGSHHEIELGTAVRLKFTRPHALSATARLEMVSHHRLDPQVDGVLLLAESCIMGNKKHSHVACRDWATELIVYRTAEGLAVRSGGPISIDGEIVETPAQLLAPTRVEGDDFALSIEPV